ALLRPTGVLTPAPTPPVTRPPWSTPTPTPTGPAPAPTPRFTPPLPTPTPSDTPGTTGTPMPTPAPTEAQAPRHAEAAQTARSRIGKQFSIGIRIMCASLDDADGAVRSLRPFSPGLTFLPADGDSFPIPPPGCGAVRRAARSSRTGSGDQVRRRAFVRLMVRD